MACNPEVLKHVPLFALLDDDETAVLAGQVELKKFAPRQRIYKMGDPGGQAYVMVSGTVRVTTVDEDHQEVVVDEPQHGEFFGFASMLEQTPHQTDGHRARRDRLPRSGPRRHRRPAPAQAARRHGYADRAGPPVPRLPATGARARQRNPNEVIEEEATFGERIADTVARFGGSWTFIIIFARGSGHLHARSTSRSGTAPGIPIRSSC